MKRAIVALIGAIAILTAGIFAMAALGLLLGSHRFNAHTAAKACVVLVCAFISCFLLFLAIGLFRFRRWALMTTIVLAGLCSVYSVARLLAKPGINPLSSWCLLLSGTGTALFLAYAIPKRTNSPARQGSRPAGVTGMAILGFVCLPLGVITIFREIKVHAPEWQVASTVFNTMLCGTLSFGLWKMREWARFLTEVTGFLAPLGVLPLLLGPRNHSPIFLTLSFAILTYAAWTIWYLRRPEVEQAFAKAESVTI